MPLEDINMAFVSINQVLDNLMRHPLLKDITKETAINYAVDFMRIVGCPAMFTNKVVELKVEDYRALLPEDYYSIIQVRESKNKSAFRYTTDSFHLSESKASHDLTYKIQGNIIYTSLKNGNIEISYTAITVDSCGYPLIPDNSVFTRALELYIKKQWFTILFDLNKINQAVLQNVQQEYYWVVGQCESEFTRPSIDQMESITNIWNNLILRTNSHSSGFRFEGNKETIRRH